MLLNHRGVTRTLTRTAVILAVTAGLAVVPTGASQADGPTVTTSDGRTLHEGSVVASGQREGDLCVFPDSTQLDISGTTSTIVRVVTDATCTLSVSKISEVADQPSVLSAGARPKYNEDTGEPVGYVNGRTQIEMNLGETLNKPLDAAKPKWESAVITVYVSQMIYDGAGLRQYGDYVQVQYLEEWTADGSQTRVRGIHPIDGRCVGGTARDVTGEDPFTEIRNCWYRTVTDGPETVSALSGGYFRQGWRVAGVGVTRDERHMSEYLEGWYGGFRFVCHLGGELPLDWSSECWADRTF